MSSKGKGMGKGKAKELGSGKWKTGGRGAGESHRKRRKSGVLQFFDEAAEADDSRQIISAFSVDHIKGFFYIEAGKQCDINEVCKGLTYIYWSPVVPFSSHELYELLSVRTKCSEVSEGTWARVKNGNYKGDLCQVVAVNNERKRATVKLIPRIDLQAMAAKFDDGVSLKKTVIPAPELISSSELDEFQPLIQIGRDNDTGLYFQVLDGMMLKDGNLYKRVSIDSISCWGVMPTEEELLKISHSDNNESNDVEWLAQLYGEKKRKKTIKSDKGSEKGDGSSGSGMENSFELLDLVFFGRKDFGLIVAMGKDDRYKILKEAPEGPVVVTVEQHELKPFDKKFTALDLHSKTISINDTTKVLEGQYEGKQGIVKQIYRGTIFLYDENETDNGGFFCCKSQNCEKIKQFFYVCKEKGGELDSSGFEDFTSSRKSPVSPKKPWQERQIRSDVNNRNREGMFSIGQTLRIRVGPQKGYLCCLLAVHYSDVTLKLDSKQKVLTDGEDMINLKLKDVGLDFSWPVERIKEVLSCSLETVKSISILGLLPSMDLRQRKGDKSQVLKRCCLRVKCFVGAYFARWLASKLLETVYWFLDVIPELMLYLDGNGLMFGNNFGSRHDDDKDKDVDVEIFRAGKKISLTQLERDHRDWLLQMHDSYDEEIVSGEDQPVIVVNPSNKKALGISYDVIRVHQTLKRKGVTWKSGQKIKVLKGACAGLYKNNVYGTTEHFLIDGLQGDFGALKATEVVVDGIVVSNHGGRQLVGVEGEKIIHGKPSGVDDLVGTFDGTNTGWECKSTSNQNSSWGAAVCSADNDNKTDGATTSWETKATSGSDQVGAWGWQTMSKAKQVIHPLQARSFLVLTLTLILLFLAQIRTISGQHDRFWLAMTWPYGYCSDRKNAPCVNQPPDHLIIHGLWPADANGLLLYPPHCVTNRYSFYPQQLNNTVDLFVLLDIDGFLKGTIGLGQKKSKYDIINAVEKWLGRGYSKMVRVQLKCVKRHGIDLLKEIIFCVDQEGHLVMSCNRQMEAMQHSCGLDITLPGQVVP
ncbi:FMN-dependent dehydrogenase [Corchorus capsularis]|uniref:FMN-dependent dehydrogenase n=1 Tax=Corchorus capsularis TaxID=210143 RepID=A0A1R3IYY3_COCAP|nr:FMN-dependent dehydrogenase [Corchorus capsularis]